MSVANIEIDITNYSGTKDFHVIPEYIDEHSFDVHVKRLDTLRDGWAENLRVLVVYNKEKSEMITIGSSPTPETRHRVTTDTLLVKGPAIQPLASYSPLPWMEPQRISRIQFNKMFSTDIVVLPKNLFAVGLKHGNVYMYNETYESYYMIELTVRHMVGVALSKNMYKQMYFVICAHDGYMEGHYLSRRFIPKQIGETDCAGKDRITTEIANEYPVFHKQKWIVAQSNQLYTPFALDVPDRYYFYLNRYNQYRSVHEGIPFSKKINKIVYGSQPRGGKHNFTKRKDIDKSQREYFYSDAVSKENIVAPPWIDRQEMIKYKYVLDIDGNSSTWDATAWKLNSNSVILKVDGPWKQWFHSEYKPWTHYVPVKDDMSDLQDKYKWCETHQSECEAMIARCKELFQKAYRFENVVKHTTEVLAKISGLTPVICGDKRVFFFTCDSSDVQHIPVAKFKDERLNVIKLLCKHLHENDILVGLNSDLIDVYEYTIEDLLKRYETFGKDIVFGAEKNLWPGSLEPVRESLIRHAPGHREFKYLNSGFFVARVGELRRLVKERAYEIKPGFIDQEYFTLAYLTGRYSMTLDYDSMLVMNNYRSVHQDIERFKEQKTPFFNHNAGR